MPTTPKDLTTDAGWQQIEHIVEELHNASREPISASEFYKQLLANTVTALAAEGGIAWIPEVRGKIKPLYQINATHILDLDANHTSALSPSLLKQVAQSSEPSLIRPHSTTANEKVNPTDHVMLVCGMSSINESQSATTLIQLFMRSGASPQAEQGWLDFLRAVCEIAREFELRNELRTLRAEQDSHDQSISLLRRIHNRGNLTQTAFELANEGRGFVGCDRLSVVVKKGNNWKLVAASGVDRIESRADATKQLEFLAENVANWGEPLEYREENSLVDLPDEFSILLEQYVDHAHARHLVAVPFSIFLDSDSDEDSHEKPSVVLIAEQFDSSDAIFSRDRTVELATFCEPAIRQSLWLDRFPLRTVLGIADGWANLISRLGITRSMLVMLLAVVAIVSLILVPMDFEIEAPANLVPVIERDVFATTNGIVREVLTKHGAEVQEGEILALLDDPQLDFEFARVQGEMMTVSKRLEAIAVSRTDREFHDQATDNRLPLSAESEQLYKKLDSLKNQLSILKQRREALILRSPINGKVITLDVQNLLRVRPIQRGEVLFTVADSSQGWKLEADIAQDQIGHILNAQKELQQDQLPVRFRLASNVEKIYEGKLDSLTETAVLSLDGLDSEIATIQAKISIAKSQALTAARPGMSAQVRFHCGRRSLGYVWLHDICESIYSWFVF